MPITRKEILASIDEDIAPREEALRPMLAAIARDIQQIAQADCIEQSIGIDRVRVADKRIATLVGLQQARIVADRVPCPLADDAPLPYGTAQAFAIELMTFAAEWDGDTTEIRQTARWILARASQ